MTDRSEVSSKVFEHCWYEQIPYRFFHPFSLSLRERSLVTCGKLILFSLGQEACHCLTRDATMLRTNERLRRTRRALLTDLSALVRLMKHLPQLARDGSPDARPVDLIDEATLKAYQVVLRAVKFLDLFEGAPDGGAADGDAAAAAAGSLAEPTFLWPRGPGTGSSPTTTTTTAVDLSLPVDATVTDAGVESSATTPDVILSFPAAAIATRARSPFARARPEPHAASLDKRDPPTSSSPASDSSPAAATSSRSGAPVTSDPPKPSAHRTVLISQRLNAAYDTFLSRQGSFIGRLHLQARLPADLLFATQQSVVACRDLLRVVEMISQRDPAGSDGLERSKNAMCAKMADLVQATKEVLRPRSNFGPDVIGPMNAEESRALMGAATDCVRAAGECVARGRVVIERVGDFGLESRTVDLDIAEIMSHFPAPVRTSLSKAAESGHRTFSSASSSSSSSSSSPSSSSSFPSSSSSSSSSTTPKEQRTSMTTTTTMTTTTATMPMVSEEDELTLRSPASPASTRTIFVSVPPRSSRSFITESSRASSPTQVRFSQHETSSVGETTVAPSTDDFDVGSAGTNNTSSSSLHASQVSVVSRASTRATSVEDLCSPPFEGLWAHLGQGGDVLGPSSVRPEREGEDDDDDDDDDGMHVDARIPVTAFAHELVCNKDGQVVGGTLPALVERLTTHDSTPDSAFVAAFYLTFRLFTTPVEFAEALIARFEYVGRHAEVSGPVRLRVYNIFKGWLESHWRNDEDRSSLPIIVAFATERLPEMLPSAGHRLGELAIKASAASGPIVPRLFSSLGKTTTSTTQPSSPTVSLPAPVVSKSQYAALRSWRYGGVSPGLLDLDPLELARQLTIRESKMFCAILPEELLVQEWTRKNESLAVNVRAMSSFSTDLTILVAETILQQEADVKKRAAVIKQWVKVARRCLELNNYDSLMAIVCALDSSHILRLKKTWEMLSQKTKHRLEELRGIVEVSRNYARLRQRLHNHVAPCLPFVGIYLTDLTFVDVGNPPTRQLHGNGNGKREGISVINFDKHMKTAKIIGELQRFQIPYRLAEVEEIQDWIEAQMENIRSSDQSNVQDHYRRSLFLEPREVNHSATLYHHHHHHHHQPWSSESTIHYITGGQAVGSTTVPGTPVQPQQIVPHRMTTSSSTSSLRDKFDLFSWASTNRERLITNINGL